MFLVYFLTRNTYKHSLHPDTHIEVIRFTGFPVVISVSSIGRSIALIE